MDTYTSTEDMRKPILNTDCRALQEHLLLEDARDESWGDTRIRRGTRHGVGLPGPRLAVGKDAGRRKAGMSG